MKRKICAGLAMLMATALPSFAQQNDRLLQLLKSELTYNMGELQKQESKPYFMSFRVEDSYQATLVSSFGVTATADTTSSRVFIPQIRIGNMQLDNFKYNTQGGSSSARGKAPTAYLPKDNVSEAALKIAIWEETLRRFNIAEARYRGAQTQSQTSVANEDKAGCFSPAPVEHYYEQPLPLAASPRHLSIRFNANKNSLKRGWANGPAEAAPPPFSLLL